MRILRRIWLQRSAFDRLQNWRTARGAARIVRDTLATALVRQAWVSWWDVVGQESRNEIVREGW